MSNQSYFGGITAGLKTLATGLKVTLKEYFTPKSTEQYPENRKTTLHVAKRHRGRLVFVRDEAGAHKCVACTMCEKSCPNGSIKILSEMREDPETGKKKRYLLDYSYDMGERHTYEASARDFVRTLVQLADSSREFRKKIKNAGVVQW